MGLCIWIGILDRAQLYLPYVHPCALCPVDTLSCPLPDNYWPQSILSAFTSMRKKNSFLCSFFSRVVCTVNVNSLGCHAHCAHFAHTMRSESLKTFRPAYWTGQEREIEKGKGRGRQRQVEPEIGSCFLCRASCLHAPPQFLRRTADILYAFRACFWLRRINLHKPRATRLQLGQS